MKTKNNKIMIFTIILIVLGSGIVSGITTDINNSIKKSEQFINLETAINVAKNQITKDEKYDFSILNVKEIFDDKGSILFYIFNLQPKGYVVVTANKNLPPVISYSYKSDFGGYSGDNILLQILTTDIQIRLDNLDVISEEIIHKRKSEWEDIIENNFNICNLKITQQNQYQTTKDGYLLETQWSQGSPYNNFCPIDLNSGARSVAGCPAVAMAQILNYHQTTNNIAFDDNDDYYHNYGGNSYWIDNDYITYDFPSFPDLNNYLTVLLSHYEQSIPLTNDDKAALVFACGIAAKQVYNPGGSGTFGVNQAYQAYLRFSFDNVSLLDENDPDLYDRLQQNIEDGYPAHIAVVNEGWTVGHNMVVDGYNVDDYYHINFGWGGSYDGWYLLPEELPFDLTVIEGVIVDIIDENSDSELHGDGVLSWVDVIPGSIVTGEFTIENVGDAGSEIDWEIIEWPGWGSWTFNPNNGTNLKPEDGELTIQVSVIAPDEPEEEFNGYVKIVDVYNNTNSCLIHVSLTTPRTVKNIFLQIIEFLYKHPHLNSLLKILFRI